MHQFRCPNFTAFLTKHDPNPDDENTKIDFFHTLDKTQCLQYPAARLDACRLQDYPLVFRSAESVPSDWECRVGRSSQVPAGVPRNREKLPLSTPKNESNLTRYWDFCEKMWHLSHPRTAILLYELADPQGSRSKGRIAVSG